MILIVVGIIRMIENTETDTTKVLMKMGMAMMVISYFLVVAWLIWSLMESQNEPSSPAHANGSMVSKLQPKHPKSTNRIFSWCAVLSLPYHLLEFDWFTG
jgi:hypothetical protein